MMLNPAIPLDTPAKSVTGSIKTQHVLPKYVIKYVFTKVGSL